MIKLPLFIIVWALYVPLKLSILLLGLVVTPILYLYRKRSLDDVPGVFLPWQNPEDWNGGPEGTEHSLPQWWVEQEGVGFWSWYKYHAIRNPANGLRNIEFLDLDIKPDEIDFWTPKYLKYYEPWWTRKHHPELKNYGYVCWQGLRAGMKFVHLWNDKRHFVIKFGWRIEPRDKKEGPDPDGQRAIEGAGFASKLLPYREG
jgi:hypothetical protein